MGLARCGTLDVEYAERGNEYGILFIFSLFCEYIQLEYVHIHGIYRVHEAEYGIRILVVAPQEYVNIYSTRRCGTVLPVSLVGDGCGSGGVPLGGCVRAVLVEEVSLGARASCLLDSTPYGRDGLAHSRSLSSARRALRVA